MKMMKAASCLFVATILVVILNISAFAEADATAGNDTLAISTSNSGGGLKEAVDASGIGYENIKTLIITVGTLNIKDTKFINQSLASLETLEVIGTADFDKSTLPASAFSGNNVIKNVKLLNVTTIGQRAFYESSGLVNVDLPQVTTIASLAFVSCSSLEIVNAPKLTSLDNRAFYGAASLTSLTLGEKPPELLGAGNWFKDVTRLTIYVPTKEAAQAYQDIYEFSDFKIKMTGDDSDLVSNTNSNTYYDNKYDANLTYSYTGPYFIGDYKVSLNLYSFNLNLNAWLKGSTNGAPPIDTMQAIRFAKDAGFDAVDVTAYYIPGYSNTSMPTKSDEEIMQYARDIKSLAKQIGIEISGTGVQNDFADPDPESRALDVKRVKYWIDVAAEMGAPVMRVFSGPVPKDISKLGWETIARDRIAPALREIAEYGAAKGVKIGLQNHGDMTATAGQTIQILKWVDHPNIGIVDDTGYFRKFRNSGLGYDWYSDIQKVLPYSNNFQVKKKPAGQETDTPMDMVRLFTDVRNSSYRGYIPVELLWQAGDPGYPKDLSEPPYEEITAFLHKVKGALDYTKTGPTYSANSTFLSDIYGNWAYSQIRQAVSIGFVSGLQDGTFQPNNGVTRAEFVTMIAKAFNLPSSVQAGFTDTSNHWAKAYVNAAAHKGIISGTGNGTFRPDIMLTRQEMAVMIAGALSLKTISGITGFTDNSSIAEWALPYVKAVSDKGIMDGKPGNRFDPSGTATKAEAVAVILRALEMKS